MNDKKVVSIIFKQCQEIGERCEGYREAIIELITEILDCERRHRISPTNIQKLINDKCNAAARFLAAKHSHGIDMEEIDS